ncbi:hypothetical protein D3C87_1991000 [compost metagenome]
MKISGRAEGSTSLVIVVAVESCSTLPTLTRSLSMDATPSAVLMSVGHSEQSVTVTAEMTSALGSASLAST